MGMLYCEDLICERDNKITYPTLPYKASMMRYVQTSTLATVYRQIRFVLLVFSVCNISPVVSPTQQQLLFN
jgi:hypothetical protein